MNIEDLENKLKMTRESLDRATASYYAEPHDSPERRSLFEAERKHLNELEGIHRRLAQATDLEYVVPVDLGFEPEAAISGVELRASDEEGVVLSFNAMRVLDTGLREECGIGVVRFPNTMKLKFGLPNDEAQVGHPLYERGFDLFFSPGEVLNSSWIQAVEEQNQKAFPEAVGWKERFRHFIFQFHDSAFECIAKDIHASLKYEGGAEAV